MSMLAEQKRKTKWVINPMKKPLWTTDSSGINFGKQLMEKMGWSAGKGLGLNEQGIQEPLRVGFKNDTKGMGFKENLDDWIEHQDEFNILLNQLRSNNDSSVVNGSNDENIGVKSLEEKSKQSKARVHYQKFTRGKDLSKYSADDLACILGTNKTKKEKMKSIDVIEAESNLNGNWETSFGVRTINSGSIEDYFKKKWITDKGKSSTFASPDDDTFKESTEGIRKENNCFSLNDDGSIKLKNEEKKSRKRKLISNSDFDSLHVEETEDIKRIEKKKKRKKEVTFSQEEHESKMKNEGGWMDESIPEESGSLPLETENSSNVVREIKEDKNHMKLEITDIVVESKKEKGKKRTKRNIDKYTVEDVSSAELIHDTKYKDNTLEGELIKRKKKKKNKEKLEVNEMLENQCDNYNQGESSNDHSNKDISEVEPVQKRKKRKRAESEKLEEINVKDFSSLQCIPSSNHNESCLNVGITEEVWDTFVTEDTMDVKSKKKKSKKKNKKEKIEEFDYTDSYNNQEVPSTGKFDLGIVGKEKISGKSEAEDITEVVSKKKKKKNRNEKVEGNKEMEYKDHHSNQIKESELEKEETIFDCQGEVILKEESVKNKKKKKHKKEKFVELETKIEEPCSKEENVNAVFEEENTVDIEFVKKKRKKKNRKEKLEECEGVENKNEQSKQSEVVEENSVGTRKEIEKSGSGLIGNKQDLSENNNSNNNEGNDVLNTNTKAENRIEKIRANLFPDKAGDKYFPQQGFNERVLKLIRWANISEFRGSNLKDVEGYGRQKQYEKYSR